MTKYEVSPAQLGAPVFKTFNSMSELAKHFAPDDAQEQAAIMERGCGVYEDYCVDTDEGKMMSSLSNGLHLDNRY